MLPAGTRLGHAERRLLLAAPSSDAVGGADAKVIPLLPAGPSPSAFERPRNVARRLREHGLIAALSRTSSGEDMARYLLTRTGEGVRGEVQWACQRQGGGWKRRTTMWFVRRTPLGDEVVRAYREELRSALTDGPLKPIRWR